MIEDALKSTRTLHRLIMTVALVTIVFALSISLPEDKAGQKQIIDNLIGTDFAAYKAFVASKVEENRLEHLQPIADKIAADLDAGGYLTFGLDTLASEFAKPVHVGQLLIDQLNLNEVPNATIVSLNALNGLSLDADIQILVPQTDRLMQEIYAFLSENTQAGKRIDTVRINIDEFDFVAESFLPGSQATVGIYFELLDAVRTGGAPAFSANFIADIVEIDDTSFLTWLRSQTIDETLVSFDGDEVVFAPGLQSAPAGFLNEKLGVLSLRLSDEIAKSSPASQSVSILGTNVPGALVIFASPIVLFALSYYFSAHTAHLTRIVTKDPGSFQEFSWLPISMKANLPFSPARIPIGIIEGIASLVLLPIAAIGLLYLRLQEFGDLAGLQVTVLASSVVGLIVFGGVAIRNIMRVRFEMSPKPAADNNSTFSEPL